MPRPNSQSRVSAPLNAILGTEANVRLLRVLSLAQTALSAAEVAHRAGLGRTSVYPALASLERTGIIEHVGVGTGRPVRFRDSHPLAKAIEALFRSESGRIDALVDELRSTVDSAASRRALSAWLDGTALGDRSIQEGQQDAAFLTCYVVADPKALHGVLEDVRSRLPAIERRFEVSIDVVGMTRSEIELRLPTAALENAVLLAGVPPTALVQAPDPGSTRDLRNRAAHGYHDASARRLAHAIALRLKQDPSLAGDARARVRRRMRVASKQEQLELKEWDRLLSLPPSMWRGLILDYGPRATRLRQSLPAVGILTAHEREAVLRADSDKEVVAILSRRRTRGTSDA